MFDTCELPCSEADSDADDTDCEEELPPRKRNISHPSPVRGKGKFKTSWKLPPYVTQSTRGDKYAYCKLCSSHFSVSHGGYNDVTRHGGATHQQRFKESKQNSSIEEFFVTPSSAHASKVISAEVTMVTMKHCLLKLKCTAEQNKSYCNK